MKLKRCFNYYKLGYDYSKSILPDFANSSKKAFEETKKMCIDTVGTPYMDSLYKDSCIYGATEAKEEKIKLDFDTFLNSFIHDKSK